MKILQLDPFTCGLVLGFHVVYFSFGAIGIQKNSDLALLFRRAALSKGSEPHEVRSVVAIL